MRALRTLLAATALLTLLVAVPAQAIPRDVVVSRAMVWAKVVRSRDASGHPTAYGVPYSQTRWAKADGTLIPKTVSSTQARYLGWRTDCSGFVAMCWDLRDYLGRPQSPTTTDYRSNPSRWYGIKKADLKPGDMMLVTTVWGASYNHAVLFAGWTDSTKTQYWAIEESSSKGGVVRRATPYPYWGTSGKFYRPYRYASIQDDFVDVITSVNGNDAYQNAVAASQVSFPATRTASVSGVVVVSSRDWTNALSAASLAAGVGGPVLLSSGASLPASTSAEIKRLKPTTVYVLGPTTVISNTVAYKIAALGPKIVRLSASDRYAMASRVATLGVSLSRSAGKSVDTAYLVNGLDFPDAFATSPITVRTSRPIVCASARTVPAATLNALKQMKIKTVVIVGSATAIGTGVQDVLKRRGYAIRRLSAADHYSLSRLLSAEASSTGASWSNVGVTSDAYFGDSLIAGTTQGFCSSMLLLSPATSLNAGVGNDLLVNRGTVRPARAYGGYAGVSWAVRSAIAWRLRQP